MPCAPPIRRPTSAGTSSATAAAIAAHTSSAASRSASRIGDGRRLACQATEITRGGSLAEALRGIEAAEAAGLGPIKVNAVVARGINEGALVDLARLTLERPWSVRFIEWMPLNGDAAQAARLVPSAEVRAMIERSLGPLRPAVPEAARSGRGPAVGYRLDGARGTIGLISPVTQHFCAACNRLRLTADGRLRLCLLADDEVDLRALVRAGAGDEEIQHALRRAVACKPAGHRLASHIVPDGRHMAEIGG